jgi:hypothetical protein
MLVRCEILPAAGTSPLCDGPKAKEATAGALRLGATLNRNGGYLGTKADFRPHECALAGHFAYFTTASQIWLRANPDLLLLLWRKHFGATGGDLSWLN